jgi:hypothetical protein
MASADVGVGSDGPGLSTCLSVTRLTCPLESFTIEIARTRSGSKREGGHIGKPRYAGSQGYCLYAQ